MRACSEEWIRLQLEFRDWNDGSAQSDRGWSRSSLPAESVLFEADSQSRKFLSDLHLFRGNPSSGIPHSAKCTYPPFSVSIVHRPAILFLYWWHQFRWAYPDRRPWIAWKPHPDREWNLQKRYRDTATERRSHLSWNKKDFFRDQGVYLLTMLSVWKDRFRKDAVWNHHRKTKQLPLEQRRNISLKVFPEMVWMDAVDERWIQSHSMFQILCAHQFRRNR